jgi:hypothetical protein
MRTLRFGLPYLSDNLSVSCAMSHSVSATGISKIGYDASKDGCDATSHNRGAGPLL